MIFQGKARYPVKEVVLHCAGVPTGYFAGQSGLQVFSTINGWHREKGWRSFGYHALVMPDGFVFRGRPYEEIGAHVIEANRGTIGVLMIESRKVERISKFEHWFTAAQGRAVESLIASVHGIERVTGHNDYAAKFCPGFKVLAEHWL